MVSTVCIYLIIIAKIFTLVYCILPSPDEGFFSPMDNSPYSCLQDKFSISLQFNWKMELAFRIMKIVFQAI